MSQSFRVWEKRRDKEKEGKGEERETHIEGTKNGKKKNQTQGITENSKTNIFPFMGTLGL